METKSQGIFSRRGILAEFWCQFHQRSTAAFFAQRSRKRKKDSQDVSFFALLGSAPAKAARITFMKLTQVSGLFDPARTGIRLPALPQRQPRNLQLQHRIRLRIRSGKRIVMSKVLMSNSNVEWKKSDLSRQERTCLGRTDVMSTS